MTNYLCPIRNDYILQGDFNSKEFHGIRLEIAKCQNSTVNGNHCKTEEQIEAVIHSGYIDISLVNSYFDFDDYETPIKRYLSSTNNLFLTNDNNTQWFDSFLKQNEALTSDGRFYGEPFKSKKFYAITNTVYKIIPPTNLTEGVLAYITFGMARESEKYERNAYTFVSMVGFLGGLSDSLFFLGFVLVSLTQSKLFNFRLIDKLYQISDSSDDSSPFKDSNSKSKRINDHLIRSEPQQ